MLRDPVFIPLSREHQHSLALCVLTARALSTDSSAAKLAEQARFIVGRFDAEIRKHFDLEEQILFPALASFPALSGLVAGLESEHRRLMHLIESLRAAGDAVDRATIDEFTTVLEAHIRKEEGLLFEQAQQVLSREQLDQVGRSLIGG